ncbi:MAG: inorganic diphosphatase [Gammaproteobacteria bacterium]|nr:inorganic diphosphatase [Gammaproteobacteria bacterium]MCP4276657.1 inorganic diphosphatase [Gammaproteobacteria bacterium]MCP4831407.1 inorganic diphosphatase [Gammaproteobacteria bacterium]MCP4927951.1 inorganic diphosphatase [Gammaproteobacteria bacterium]
MRLEKITSGKNPPDEVNVVIEVPLGGEPIKYEVDKVSGAMFVDRFLYTATHYPCNYGFIPNTLSDDGDPVDVMVYGSRALVPGAVLGVRPLGVLIMEDEAGLDEKILAVPCQRLTPYYDHIKGHIDLPQLVLDRISHFFEQYKALEPNKWVKVKGWEGIDVAKQLILDGIEKVQTQKNYE